jgi:hypothetical protein
MLMPEMPGFLKRSSPSATERKKLRQRREKFKTEHPGSRLKMPDRDRVDPRHRVRAENTRSSMRNPGKGEKVKHLSTEAIKLATLNLTNGDKRAALYNIAIENGIDPSRWDELNNGQVSMNLSNILRGRYYKDDTVVIQGRELP